MVAGVSAAAPAAPESSLRDAGSHSLAQRLDGGTPSSSRSGDGGDAGALSAPDKELVDNLELLEHLPEAELLDVLLPLRDQ